MQIENTGLRSNQSVLLVELLALRRELAALGQHAGLELAGPSPALQSILQQQQGASSSGAPQPSRVLVRIMATLVVSAVLAKGGPPSPQLCP